MAAVEHCTSTPSGIEIQVWDFDTGEVQTFAPAPAGRERRPLGCALAMRVMQSDLYRQLDDAERADCDELVQRNLEWFQADAEGLKR